MSESEDYGFELPDTRHGFYDTSGEFVAVKIVRHWYENEGGEPRFKCSYDIHRGNDVTHLPVGCDDSYAIRKAHELYDEDTEATAANDEVEAMYAAERRMGA